MHLSAFPSIFLKSIKRTRSWMCKKCLEFIPRLNLKVKYTKSSQDLEGAIMFKIFISLLINVDILVNCCHKVLGNITWQQLKSLFGSRDEASNWNPFRCFEIFLKRGIKIKGLFKIVKGWWGLQAADLRLLSLVLSCICLVSMIWTEMVWLAMMNFTR